VRRGGGAGGQKGVRDVIDRLGPDFARLKIGIERPPARWTTEHWVLSRFRDDEAELVERVVDAAADGVEAALRDGVDAAANAVNGVDLREPAKAEEDAVEDADTADVPPRDAAKPDG
jgi:PTH1 family peptidyl-tRNA hydrolase